MRHELLDASCDVLPGLGDPAACSFTQICSHTVTRHAIVN